MKIKIKSILSLLKNTRSMCFLYQDGFFLDLISLNKPFANICFFFEASELTSCDPTHSNHIL